MEHDSFSRPPSLLRQGKKSGAGFPPLEQAAANQQQAAQVQAASTNNI